VEGLALGGVQILLLLAAGAFTAGSPQSLPLPLMGILSACSYLVVALLEGFFASARTGKIRAGINAAWLVSGVSVLPVVLTAMVFAILAITAPPPQPCSVCTDVNDERGLVFIAFLLLSLAAMVWAWILSTIGGWIGGMVGKRDASQPTVTA
jgi:hypothetical protein